MRVLAAMIVLLVADVSAAEKVVVMPVRGDRVTDSHLLKAFARVPGVEVFTLEAARELHGDLAGCSATECMVKNGANAGLRWVVIAETGRLGQQNVAVLKRVRIPDLRVQREVEVVATAKQLAAALPGLVQRLWARDQVGPPKPSLAAIFRSEDVDRIVGELWVAALAEVGSHRVIGAGDVEGVLEATQCMPPACKVPLGSALSVDEIATFNLGRIGREAVVRATLIDVKATKVRARETMVVPDDSTLNDTLRRMARALLAR